MKAKLWRVIDYLRDRPQEWSVRDDAIIFDHSVRLIKNAIEALEKERLDVA